MTRYRRVEVGTWNDSKFRELSSPLPNAQTLWLYLLSGPRTTIFPGIVIATRAVIADDLGWPVSGDLFSSGGLSLQTAWEEIEARGMAIADWKAGVVQLPKALMDSSGEARDTAVPTSPNVFKSWAKTWSDIPDCDIKTQYLVQLGYFAKALDARSERVGDAYHKAYLEAFGKPMLKLSEQLRSTLREPARDPDPDPVTAPVPASVPDPEGKRRAKLTVVQAGKPEPPHPGTREALKKAIVARVGPRHAEIFARLKSELGSTAMGPSVVDKFEKLRELLDEMPSLEGAQERCEYSLAIREAEARHKRTLQFFGPSMWKRETFEKSLTFEIADVDGTRSLETRMGPTAIALAELERIEREEREANLLDVRDA